MYCQPQITTSFNTFKPMIKNAGANCTYSNTTSVAYYGPSRQRLRMHHEIKRPYKALLTSQLLGDTLGFLLHKAVYLMENPVYIVNTMSMISKF